MKNYILWAMKVEKHVELFFELNCENSKKEGYQLFTRLFSDSHHWDFKSSISYKNF